MGGMLLSLFQSSVPRRSMTNCLHSLGLRVVRRSVRSRFVAFSTLLCALFSIGADAADRPNVVLIMADDMGYECVGANGGTSYQTPHLDQLANTGLRFTNCHSQPICTPSRVQLMTGIYNHRNYIRFGLLDPQAYTFGHLFRDAGYRTCIAGKWQLEGGFEGPGHFGFDDYCLWQLTRRPSRYPNPGLEINGREQDYTTGEYGPDIVTDHICSFIRDHQSEPFFVYYPMILPHWPFEPTPDSDDWDPTAKGVLKGQGKTRYFADMVTYTDKMVGKIVTQLDELGLRNKTLVLVTGDNGTATSIVSRMGETEIPGGKGKTSDNGTHVTLIASRPGAVPAGVCEDLVDFSDMLPTLAEVIGASLPSSIRFDGVSFASQLEGKPGTPREWSYCWYERNGKRDKASQHVRTARYKLYHTGKFYDTVADPYEKSPLRELTDEQKQIRRTLRGVLKEKMDEAAAATPGQR